MPTMLPTVAIIGQPNVGKSSLFNRLLGGQEAIVAREAGTTRDKVQRQAEHRGKPFLLVDTAGLYKESGEPELDSALKVQIEDAIAEAELLLLVVDASLPISQQVRQILKTIHKAGKKVVVAANKIDRTKYELPAEMAKLGNVNIVGTSAATGNGLRELLNAIAIRIPKLESRPAISKTIGLLGRPNVGKSSIFNALLGKPAAIVSDKPHTTRDVNIAPVEIDGKKYELLDTGGLRRPGKRTGIEKFSHLRTARAIERCEVCVLVIDATEPSVAMDQKIAAMVKDANKGLVIALNKWDLVEEQDHSRALMEQKLQRDFVFVWYSPVVFMSAISGQNLRKLLELSQFVIENRSKNFDEHQLNQILRQAAIANRPKVKGRGLPKFDKITQTDTSPPTFQITGQYLGKLHTSYRRYLENQLISKLEIIGTPIILKFMSQER